eukprot:g25835.t1
MGLTLSLCPAELAHHGLSFDSKFEIDEGNVLGTGKFSTVYMCFRRGQPNRRFALKATADHPEGRGGDVIEYHPSIIRLVDMDQSTSNTIRLVLELCEGGELYDRIQQKRYYSESDTKLLVKNLLEAAAMATHRGNDLVSNTDIKVSDFGLAKLSKDWPRKLPRSTSICGSDFYLAPEVIKQEELPCESTRCPLSARSIFISQGPQEYGREIDVWSTGVITYVVLSGALPFFNSVLHKLYRQIVERDLSFSDARWKSVSAGAQDAAMLREGKTWGDMPVGRGPSTGIVGHFFALGDRLTAEQALLHPWLRTVSGSSFASESSSTRTVPPNYYSGAVPVK